MAWRNLFMYCHKKGVSSCQLARDLGITQKTTWFLEHRIREMVKAPQDKELDKIVEFDETWIVEKRHQKVNTPEPNCVNTLLKM